MSGARRGGRRLRQKSQTVAAFDSAWRHWKNIYPPICQFSDDEIEAIHRASLKVLSDIGIKVLSPLARDFYARAGMTVREEIVHFDPDLVMELIGKAPGQVTMKARGEDRDVTIGRGHVGVCTTGGTPNFSDLQQGRQPGTLAALDDFCRLAQSFDVIHVIGPFVEAQDVPTHLRHYHMTRSVVRYTDKVPFVFFRGTEAVADAYEIIRLANGLSQEEFKNAPRSYSIANSNSPLILDDLMCKGIIDAARAGQLMVLTPFTLSGAMAPVSIAGALVQQNAEALAGLCLSQIVSPGAPVCYGSFTSNVDMRTGSPAFGTPEYTKAAFASGQLARRYDLPLRSSGVTASNAPDAQAAYEMQMSLWGALMGGTNLLMHGAGWLEGGLTASAEKFVMDIEMLQMFAELFKPLSASVDELALDAIRDVGHGGHFFGTEHTLARFETAFYSPLLSDWSNFENWQDRGSVDATQRANRIYRETLERYGNPALPEDRLEAIDAFIAKRTEEGGADVLK
ncbi:trimethylamine methyltransferase family protein [Kiloniella sp. b19]|uniref:trimethylamine methyltransferase family protein n=1 Tax=Kiloniella sp. GXU_MW_B19 TaxID=3141326 RepID=UPI0031D5C232